MNLLPPLCRPRPLAHASAQDGILASTTHESHSFVAPEWTKLNLSFSVTLSYISLIIRAANNPRKEEGKFFCLCKGLYGSSIMSLPGKPPPLFRLPPQGGKMAAAPWSIANVKEQKEEGRRGRGKGAPSPGALPLSHWSEPSHTASPQLQGRQGCDLSFLSLSFIFFFSLF